MRTTKLAMIQDEGESLELPEGKTISLNSCEFNQWLLNPENRSFRFIAGFAGEQSFTARKETSKKGEADYWYGYRKVEGKLHKRYIGKSEDVTLERLKEVVAMLDTPPEPRQKSPKTNEVTQNDSVINSEELAQLQAEIQRLQNELGNTKSQLKVALGEFAA